MEAGNEALVRSRVRTKRVGPWVGPEMCPPRPERLSARLARRPFWTPPAQQQGMLRFMHDGSEPLSHRPPGSAALRKARVLIGSDPTCHASLDLGHWHRLPLPRAAAQYRCNNWVQLPSRLWSGPSPTRSRTTEAAGRGSGHTTPEGGAERSEPRSGCLEGLHRCHVLARPPAARVAPPLCRELRTLEGAPERSALLAPTLPRGLHI